MINRSSLLAIKALTELAGLPPNESQGASTIAQKIKAPSNYLGKLLQSLVVHGLVVSQKGKGGGFRLGKNPEKISLYDIVACIEDVDKWSDCFLGRKQCLDASPCPIHEQWKVLRQHNIKFLKSVSLTDLN